MSYSELWNILNDNCGVHSRIFPKYWFTYDISINCAQWRVAQWHIHNVAGLDMIWNTKFYLFQRDFIMWSIVKQRPAGVQTCVRRVSLTYLTSLHFLVDIYRLGTHSAKHYMWMRNYSINGFMRQHSPIPDAHVHTSCCFGLERAIFLLFGVQQTYNLYAVRWFRCALGV